MKTRTKFGDIAYCDRCGTDIEFHGKPRREPFVNGTTIIRGGWLDRGNDRFCTKPGNRLHKPQRWN